MSARLFDSHCHLDFPVFDGVRDEVLRRAAAVGIEKLFVPGCFPEQWQRLEALVRGTTDVGAAIMLSIHCGIGLHPEFMEETSVAMLSVQELMEQLELSLKQTGAVAVGECGLDRRYPLAKQEAVFEAQLALAREKGLPVVLHQVGLQREFLTCLRRVGVPGAGGIVHAFGGDAGWGKALLKKGLRLGIGTAVFCPARQRLRAALCELPLEGMVIETDAPGVSYRERAGGTLPSLEPSTLVQVVSRLAALMGREPQEVAWLTFENARRVYQLG